MNGLRRVHSPKALEALRGSIVLAVSAGYFCYVFRVTDGDFLRSGLSGWLDPYFLNYLAEHWYHSLWHLADPASPPMFFPVRGALGYSCGLILYAPFYVLVRPFLHPFTAYSVMLLLVMETGSLSLYVLLRKFVRLGFLEALLLTALFFSSRNVINAWHTNVWSQTASVFLVPPILLLTLSAARMPRRWPSALVAGLSGLLCTLLFTQDFYTGWFLLLISVLLLVGALIVAPKRQGLAWLGAVWRAHRPRILTFALGAAVGAGVFVWVYLGAYQERHGFPETQLLSALAARNVPHWRDPIAAVRSLIVYSGVRSFELVAAIAFLSWIPWLKIPWRVRVYTLWFLVVSAIVVLGAVKFTQYSGWRNYSVWKQLFRLLPGYAMIRDPKRIIYVYELTVALLTGLFLAQLPRRSVVRVATVVLAAALLLFEPNRDVFRFDRSRQMFDRWVQAPIDVDRSCRSFLVTRASAEYQPRQGNMTYGLDAMFIALNLSIPTLNGYSAWQPPGWSLDDPTHPWYPAAARQWIADHHLQGVCQLDLEARTMKPY